MNINREKFEVGMARQLELFECALADGMPRRGWKVGVNVPEMLARLELPHPGIGWLDGNRVYQSGEALPISTEARLRLEPEVAICVSSAVPANCSTDLARSLIGSVQPAIEVVDYARPTTGFDDVIAHSMFHDATILGPICSFDLVGSLGERWPTLRVEDREFTNARSDLVPGDLGELISFAASFLAEFGQSLEAGDLVMSGSYHAEAAEISIGEEAVADFGTMGSISIRVSQEIDAGASGSGGVS